MKTPPFLLGATLLFWGWQTGFPVVGALLGAALEGARFVKERWEFTDEDFNRTWILCTLLLLASIVYAFTTNGGPASFGSFLQDPGIGKTTGAGVASSRTATSALRWLPMIFFLFIAAQTYSSSEGIPLTTISLLLGLRWKKAKELGLPLPAQRTVNVSYPYFVVCLLSASAHGNDITYYWGLSALVVWGLWPFRSPRFALAMWAVMLGVIIASGYYAQRGLGQLSRVIMNYNPQWLTDLSGNHTNSKESRTAIGRIGQMKLSGKIIIRLEPQPGTQPPQYLREASYRTYHSSVWRATEPRYDFGNVPSEADNTTWILQHGKINRESVNISCYLDGGKALLPLPSGCGRLEELPAFVLEKNSFGAVRATGPGLVIFEAFYGPGATIDSDPNTNEDLAIPPAEEEALDKVIDELKLKGASQAEVERGINAFFETKFTYSLWQKKDAAARTNETAISRFLLKTRHGHCEFFATSTVLLLRRLGIPARYAVGYAVHEASGNKFVVRLRDAHAWCLVWRNGAWHDLDTTPASWVRLEGERASPFQMLSDLWSDLGFQLSKLRWGQTNLRMYLLGIVVPVLVVLLYQIIFRSKRRLQQNQSARRGTLTPWPGLDSEFYQLEKELARRGITRDASEPQSAWLQRAARDPELAGVKAPLQELLRLHYRHRFDPHGLNAADREALRRQTQVCLASLEQQAAPHQSIRI